jgi:hypothetical protein
MVRSPNGRFAPQAAIQNRSFGNSRMSLLQVHCLTGQIDFPDFPSSKVTATAPIADNRTF